MAIPLAQLVLADAQRAEAAYERLGEDEWMFTLGRPRQVRLQAEWEDTRRRVTFEITQIEDHSIVIKLFAWHDGNVDVLHSLLSHPKYDVEHGAAEAHDMGLVWSEEEYNERVRESQNVRQAADLRWAETTRGHTNLVELVGPSFAPVSSDTLQSIADALRSNVLARRNSGKALLKELNESARGLLGGAFELGGEDGKPDLSFVEDRGVLPLRKLGSGTQALVSLLAALHLTQSAALCVEEPETHQNPNQQLALVRLFEHRALERIGPQIFIATHSNTLAAASVDLRLLERDGDRVVARRSDQAQLRAKFGQHLNLNAPPDSATEFVGEDGAVRLPKPLRDDLGILPRELVFFVKRSAEGEPSRWEVVSLATMELILGEEPAE
ncbi:ATP-binding protein [Myxococcota bacterium]|nr:ATP-binding protein [Myxococcota bacterium]